MALGSRAAAAVACVCAIAGVCALSSSASFLIHVWRSDDLKSVGCAVPFVSFVLIVRAWRSLGWEARGTWWGFVLLACTAVSVFLRDQLMLVLTVHKNWLVQLPPVPLLAILYAASLVLLFGGARLLRAAWFPVLFMGAVLPVPQTFSQRVDLPLQHASATVARGFAHLLGERLTSDHLRLMFTPEFGMFIAPGCNGIRGAVTLGLAAVVVAYVYRFRWFVAAPVVVGAVLLGYLFNFARLCLLVVYYKIALPYPWLQDRAKGADYLLGGALFLLAVVLFFAVTDRLRGEPRDVSPASAPLPLAAPQPAGSLLLRAGAVLALTSIFGLDYLHAQRKANAQLAELPPMPDHLGAYKLVRTFQDTLTTGVVVYTWGEYQRPAGGASGPSPRIAVGVSPELDTHDVEVCHIARGEDPTWHGELLASSPGGTLALVAATYNNGLVQTLEASTVCDGGQCRQFTQQTGNMVFVYAHPHRLLPMGENASRPVPMLLKVESADVGAPVSTVEPGLAAEIRTFLQGADLTRLAERFGRLERP